jgi:nucleotide-binding universal stress UspA family protein
MKILLATDGTEQSQTAVEALKTLGLKDGDAIEIVTVIETVYPSVVDIYGGYLPDTGELRKKERDSALAFLQEAAQKAGSFFSGVNIAISTEVLSGSPESAIVERAEETGADLIVVGSHGYRAWERLLIGSVSDSVVHHAPCSVLVVRPKKS